MNILVVGAGYVGQPLVEALVSGGHCVWAVKRVAPVRDLGATWILGDVNSIDAARLPKELGAVIYLVAAGDSSADAYRLAYYDGFRALIPGVLQNSSDVTRLIYVSSTGVYGQENGEEVDEDSPAQPTRDNVKWLLEGERLAATQFQNSVIVRFSGIYGPGRSRTIKEALAAVPEEPPQIDIMTNRIHRDDCVGTLLHLLSLPAPNPCYIATDCRPAARLEVLSFIRAVAGLPSLPTKSGGQTTGIKGKVLSNKRLLESGYRFKFPTFIEGYQCLLAENRDRRNPSLAP